MLVFDPVHKMPMLRKHHSAYAYLMRPEETVLDRGQMSQNAASNRCMYCLLLKAIDGLADPVDTCIHTQLPSRYNFRTLFDLILYVPSTIFQLCRDGSSWVEPLLS